MIKKLGIFRSIVVIILLAITIASAGNIVETVERGTYQIKQAAVTGKMTAHMQPGMYPQMFGDYEIFPVAQTFYFTSDNEEGENRDQSIEVRFNDGSVAKISGTLRITMPSTKEDAIGLVTKHSFGTYREVEDKLILPIVRRAMRNTANLMTARESYAEKRNDFISWSWDQIENGLYATEEKTIDRIDPISGDTIKAAIKVIKKDNSGNPIYEKNPLEGTGVKLSNFEVKVFNYSDKVRAQIAKQQEALMAIATAQAEAAQAEEERIKKEAEGKAKVMEAQYEKEQEKIRAVVKAEEKLEVATLERKAAEQEKQKEILLGEGEATRKRLVMSADGALKEKLSAWVTVQKTWAEAFTNRKVPAYYIAGGGSGSGSGLDTDEQSAQFMNFMNIYAAKQLSLDLEMKGNTSGK